MKPGRFGAGVLTKAPGVGRWGVAGAIWKAMMESLEVGVLRWPRPGDNEL